MRGDGYYGYSTFDTQTINMLLTYRPTTSDTITVKAIDNELDTELPFRMSLNQFKQNPFQKGCKTNATKAAGCATNPFSATGNTSGPNSDAVLQTAEEAGANRDDRRTIGGVRWEHAFDAATTGQVQIVVDDRDINQPTGTDQRHRRLSFLQRQHRHHEPIDRSPDCRRSLISAPSGTIFLSTACPTTSLREATPSSDCCSRKRRVRR